MPLTPKSSINFIYNSIPLNNVAISQYLPWNQVDKIVKTTISKLKNTNTIKNDEFLEFRIMSYQRDLWITEMKPLLDWALDGGVVSIDGVDYYLADNINENKPQKISGTYEKFLTWEKKGA